MYTIKHGTFSSNGSISFAYLGNSFLLNTKSGDYIVENPRIRTEVNTVGEGSFTIYSDHPEYSKLQMLRTGIEVADEYGVIFRGRITEDTKDFYNRKAVDLEGAMAFFNDSVVRDYKFPDDWEKEDHPDHEAYMTAALSGNVVEFYLSWLISQHNAQVESWQRFMLGNVTVTDPNNHIERESTQLPSTWEELKSKLFDSSLGGFLCIRYERFGNYIDYLKEFTEVNEQGINLGENLLDLSQNTDGTATYSAIIPRGAEASTTSGDTYEGMYGTITGGGTKNITIDDEVNGEKLPDGAVTDDGDIVKKGDILYSKKAVAAYGWRVAPRDETFWEDVKEVANLQAKGVEYLEGNATKLPNTINVTALDLHVTDAQIRSFRIYRKIPVRSEAHGIDTSFDLTALDIPLLEPQNTKITVGKTVYSLAQAQSNAQRQLGNFATNKQIAAVAAAADEQVRLIRTSIGETAEGVLIDCKTTYATGAMIEQEVTSAVKVAMGNIDLSVHLKDYAKSSDVDKISGDVDKISGDVEDVSAQLELAIVTDPNTGKIASAINVSAELFTLDSDALSIEGGIITTRGNEKTAVYDYGYYTTVSGGKVYSRGIFNTADMYTSNYCESDLKAGELHLRRYYYPPNAQGHIADARIGWHVAAETYYGGAYADYFLPFVITSRTLQFGSKVDEDIPIQYGSNSGTCGALAGYEWQVTSDKFSVYADDYENHAKYVSFGYAIDYDDPTDIGAQITLNGVNWDDLVRAVRKLGGNI
jgi:hypothetical protein